MDFIGKFYSENVSNVEFIKYKQSDEIINDINLYMEDVIRKSKVLHDFTENKIYTIKKSDVL